MSGKSLVSLEKEKKKKVKHTPQYKMEPFFGFTFRHECWMSNLRSPVTNNTQFPFSSVVVSPLLHSLHFRYFLRRHRKVLLHSLHFRYFAFLRRHRKVLFILCYILLCLFFFFGFWVLFFSLKKFQSLVTQRHWQWKKCAFLSVSLWVLSCFTLHILYICLEPTTLSLLSIWIHGF